MFISLRAAYFRQVLWLFRLFFCLGIVQPCDLLSSNLVCEWHVTQATFVSILVFLDLFIHEFGTLTGRADRNRRIARLLGGKPCNKATVTTVENVNCLKLKTIWRSEIQRSGTLRKFVLKIASKNYIYVVRTCAADGWRFNWSTENEEKTIFVEKMEKKILTLWQTHTQQNAT